MQLVLPKESQTSDGSYEDGMDKKNAAETCYVQFTLAFLFSPLQHMRYKRLHLSHASLCQVRPSIDDAGRL